jgi:D-glycero-alpha-D-manno-heptose-7-phosphate kinase
VGLLHALHAYAERHAGAEQLAREACQIEIERCGEPIGKQDQYAAAFGGLNFIEFDSNDAVRVEPIICRRETIHELQDHTLVFYTGITRSASAILKKQQAVLSSQRKKQNVTRRMVELAHTLRTELQQNRAASFGEIIHEGWMLKRSLGEDISSAAIDDWYARARKAGAVGGKLLGAGTGGFLMFYAPPECHDAIAAALKLRRMAFRFEPQGSRIIFVHN